MAGEVKSLFQRLQERRAAVSAGDPTGGESMGDRGGNQKAVAEQASSAAGTQSPVQKRFGTDAANLTPAQRRQRIKELEAEIKRMK